MTVEKSLVRIEAMLCELLQLAREDEGESTFSAGPRTTSKMTRSESISPRNGPASEEDTRLSFADEPNTVVKRARSASGSSCEQTDSTGTSEGIDENNITNSLSRINRGSRGDNDKFHRLKAARSAKRVKRKTVIVSDSSAEEGSEKVGTTAEVYRRCSVIDSPVFTEKGQDDVDSMDDFIVDDEDSA
ncbi:hypothetical protein FIBSPDRAFT_900021 [Athelia psychrophila]|uniref:Uncharacterized protein n=1 Tax=Athelia psychrophila TaxID=1759441 RepID=A0A165YYC8_9AGAM|nr:hypothetical protein FIBSPDRAFT_900021 [Fibularhizoctonia sp. CBS 109695]